MPKGPRGEKRPADANQLAKLIADIATGEASDEPSAPRAPKGQSGGKVGGKARAASLSAERRSQIAREAAAKRWAKKP